MKKCEHVWDENSFDETKDVPGNEQNLMWRCSKINLLLGKSDGYLKDSIILSYLRIGKKERVHRRERLLYI